MTTPAYLEQRPAHVHSESRWSQFRYASQQLRLVVRDLLAAAALPAGGRVLDYGCADSPYANEVPAGVTYVGADLPGNPNAEVDLLADGTVPLPDSLFDVVLSTQVLEHVEETARYLQECHRLLKPGGSLILSTHGIMYYHRDPEDYWRWTRPGLEKVISDAGFEVAETRGVLAVVAAAIQIFQDGTLWKLPRRLQPLYAAMMQPVIRFVDRRYEEASRVDNCLTIALRAVKPGQDPAVS